MIGGVFIGGMLWSKTWRRFFSSTNSFYLPWSHPQRSRDLCAPRWAPEVVQWDVASKNAQLVPLPWMEEGNGYLLDAKGFGVKLWVKNNQLTKKNNNKRGFGLFPSSSSSSSFRLKSSWRNFWDVFFFSIHGSETACYFKGFSTTQ